MAYRSFRKWRLKSTNGWRKPGYHEEKPEEKRLKLLKKYKEKYRLNRLRMRLNRRRKLCEENENEEEMTLARLAILSIRLSILEGKWNCAKTWLKCMLAAILKCRNGYGRRSRRRRRRNVLKIIWRENNLNENEILKKQSTYEEKMSFCRKSNEAKCGGLYAAKYRRRHGAKQQPEEKKISDMWNKRRRRSNAENEINLSVSISVSDITFLQIESIERNLCLSIGYHRSTRLASIPSREAEMQKREKRLLQYHDSITNAILLLKIQCEENEGYL